MMYYVKTNNRIIGPFNPERLHSMLKQGKLHEDDSLSPDKENWRKIADMKAVFDLPESDEEQSIPDASVRKDNGNPSKISVKLRTTPQISKAKELTKEKLNMKKDLSRDNLAINMPQLANPPQRDDDSLESLCKSEKTSCLSVLWNPLEALPAIYEERDEFEITAAGLALALISALLLFVAAFDWRHLMDGEFEHSFIFFSTIAYKIAVPIFMLFFANAIVRILCSVKNRGGFAGDLLIAGAAALPVSMGVCVCALLGRYVGLDVFQGSEVGRWLLAIVFGSILLYCLICFLLIMLAGILRINEIEERTCVLVMTWNVLMGVLFSLGAYRLIIAIQSLDIGFDV